MMAIIAAICAVGAAVDPEVLFLGTQKQLIADNRAVQRPDDK
jgi:hypothetical protein